MSTLAYVWLAATGLLLGGWEIFRRRDAAPMAVFWFAGSAVFTADYLVMDLLQMYYYLPGLLPGLIPDTTMGVFLAELGFVAGWATFVVYRFTPMPAAAIGTAMLLLVEVLFRRWDLFEGRTWQLWHSAITFPPYFLLTHWFKTAAERRGLAEGWVRTVTRISIALWWSHLLGMITYWIMAGVIMHLRLAPTWPTNQTLGAIFTVGPFLNPAILWVMAARGRERLTRVLWSSAGLLLVGQFWVTVGLWHFRAPWNLWVHTAAQIAALYAAVLCDDWVEARAATRVRL